MKSRMLHLGLTLALAALFAVFYTTDTEPGTKVADEEAAGIRGGCAGVSLWICNGEIPEGCLDPAYYSNPNVNQWPNYDVYDSQYACLSEDGFSCSTCYSQWRQCAQ